MFSKISKLVDADSLGGTVNVHPSRIDADMLMLLSVRWLSEGHCVPLAIICGHWGALVAGMAGYCPGGVAGAGRRSRRLMGGGHAIRP